MNGDTFMTLMLVLTAFFAGCFIAFMCMSYKCNDLSEKLNTVLCRVIYVENKTTEIHKSIMNIEYERKPPVNDPLEFDVMLYIVENKIVRNASIIDKFKIGTKRATKIIEQLTKKGLIERTHTSCVTLITKDALMDCARRGLI